MEHTFFRCKRLHPFWKKVTSILINKLDKKITLDETSVLLGIEQNHEHLSFKELRFINKIVILGKLSIIRSQMNKTPIDLIFEREMKLRNIDF